MRPGYLPAPDFAAKLLTLLCSSSHTTEEVATELQCDIKRATWYLKSWRTAGIVMAMRDAGRDGGHRPIRYTLHPGWAGLKAGSPRPAASSLSVEPSRLCGGAQGAAAHGGLQA